MKYKFWLVLKIINRLNKCRVFPISSRVMEIFCLRNQIQDKKKRRETPMVIPKKKKPVCLHRSFAYQIFTVLLRSLKMLMNSPACYDLPTAIYSRSDENVDSAGSRYPFRDESVPLMELTARIISKVFLLDGRQVLFHVSINTPKPSGKPSGEKEEVYVRVESESEATKETFRERKGAPCELE